jgi:hypothetical protein
MAQALQDATAADVTWPWVQAVVDKCRVQQDSCLRLGSAFYIWRDHLQRRHAGWLLTAVVVAGLTMMQMLLGFGGERADLIAGTLVVLTTAAVGGYFAFNREMPLEVISNFAKEFISLADRFGNAAAIIPLESDEKFEQLIARFNTTFQQAMERKEAIWKAAPPIPERFTKQAWQRPAHPILAAWPRVAAQPMPEAPAQPQDTAPVAFPPREGAPEPP